MLKVLYKKYDGTMNLKEKVFTICKIKVYRLESVICIERCNHIKKSKKINPHKRKNPS